MNFHLDFSSFLVWMKFETRSSFDFIFLKLMHSNKKDKLCPGFEVEHFTKYLRLAQGSWDLGFSYELLFVSVLAMVLSESWNGLEATILHRNIMHAITILLLFANWKLNHWIQTPNEGLTPNMPLTHTSFTYSKGNMYLNLIFLA